MKEKIACPNCAHEFIINPASLLGKRRIITKEQQMKATKAATLARQLKAVNKNKKID